MKLRSFKASLLALMLFCASGPLVLAQQGYSSAGVAMGKMRSDYLQIPAPEEIVLEEYFNYHLHKLPMPKAGEKVAMDLRWEANTLDPADREGDVFQIGLTTGFLSNFDKVPPVNVSLVIDKSGSMSGPRIEKAKAAAKAFVDRLRPVDYISIVAFDHGVQVLLDAQPASNQFALKRAIDNLYAGGSTDMNLGMVTGYREVVKNYKPGYNNKVLMLTDALTNTGQIDPEMMVRNSDAYHADYHIDFTIIGIGIGFNNDLARQLSKNSRSSIHFLNDEDDLKKVFIDEIESLLAPVARDVQLSIEVDADLELVEFYGYAPKMKGQKIVMDLDKMNSGLTQVILAKFRTRDDKKKGKAQIACTLSFYDIQAGKRVSMDRNLAISLKADPSGNKDGEVVKNVAIAEMATALKEMATLFKKGKHEEAIDRIDDVLYETRKQFPGGQDADVDRIKDILRKYSRAVNQYLARD